MIEKKKKLEKYQKKSHEEIERDLKYTPKIQLNSDNQFMHMMTNYFKCVLVLFDGKKIFGLYPYYDYQEFSIEDINKLVSKKQIKVSFIIKEENAQYNTLIPKPLDRNGNYDGDSYKELDDIYIEFFERISSKIIWNEL